jgi:hypothetical protein
MFGARKMQTKGRFKITCPEGQEHVVEITKSHVWGGENLPSHFYINPKTGKNDGGVNDVLYRQSYDNGYIIERLTD